ncbi:EscV/YscV/HrcV family type III secretion system export apparatus protein [Exilibacterium tricleocarpae]|uniref:EscV/YscV/HrcV family type III secretion system export apparatus protein n=1 Tax=Exilibacterium tricleocarpae TaxID=2591008 RepID=A0A545SYA9_9GAMM|nr:type III secretion system export apparatus subunit SctV [Exilibacterium tricleocarpae]TQV69948.1 EscV/YscV/HrcV family type III secretion system export apparatus protein [Exilibacterium tricleocarpae]
MNLKKSQQLLESITRRKDVVLAVFMISIIFVMILPMPTGLVDVFIAFNITIAIVLLMLSIYIGSPLSFSSFPSVLLIATLFRLALSVTTTRLILLQADAGEIITTFGEFVVGGNVIVGVVVFSIITVVQFIVVTKGAERIAEVAARFSLDAMPGKQMSIDGDMRAGIIDAQEARRRRGNLEKESQLYGSLDGAMKFVKGDAIAGIFIILINIIGGISVGTLQHDMELGEASRIYVILTVGDGLVSQIPALFIAITSGIIVTRVNSDEAGNLGDDIGSQVLAEPKAMLICSAALLCFAMIPGFPTVTFLTLSLITVSIGVSIHILKKRMRQDGGAFIKALSEAREGSESVPPINELALAAPIAVDINPLLQTVIGYQGMNTEFARLRHSLYMELGVPFPSAQVRPKFGLEEGCYEICLHEVPMAQGELRAGHVLAQTSAERLGELGIAFVEQTQSATGVAGLWVAEARQQGLSAAGIVAFNGNEVLVNHLSTILRRHAAEFLGTQEASQLLSQLKPGRIDLLRELQGIVPLQTIGAVLKLVVAENIPIRNLSMICEVLLMHGKDEKDPALLAELVRVELRRQISHKHAGADKVITALLLDRSVEDAIRGAIRKGEMGVSVLQLDAGMKKNLIERLSAALNVARQGGKSPVLLTAQDIRRFVRGLIEPSLSGLSVLSFQELAPEVSVQTVDQINLY